MAPFYVLRQRVLLTLALFATGPVAVFAQTPLQFRMRVEPAKVSEKLNVINLRPNVETKVGLYLPKNPDAADLENLPVRLVQVVDDQVKVLTQATVKSIPGNNEEYRLVFAKSDDKAPGKKDDKKGDDLIDIAAYPFQLQLWIPKKVKGEDGFLKQDLDVRIIEPRDFVKVPYAYFEKEKQRLLFKVKLAEAFVGPYKSTVRLVLGPELKETKKGTFKQVLTKPDEEIELFADELEFVPGAEEGLVYLTVDDYDRAFTFPITLKGQGDLTQRLFNKEIGVHMRVPQYAIPSEKFPVLLEIDGPLDPAYKLELGLDRTGKKKLFQDRQTFIGNRKQKFQLGFAPSGDLVFKTEVRDWQTEIDTAGVFNPAWLRVRVLKDDKENKLTRTRRSRPGEAVVEDDPRLGDTDLADLQLFAKVVLDVTSPQDMQFVLLPKEWVVGKPFKIQVRLGKRDAELQTPIEKVLLLRGKVPVGAKFDPDSVLRKAEFDEKNGTWTFDLPGQEKKGTFEFTVQFTTQTGLQAAETRAIDIKDIETQIKGKVVHGPIPQPNLVVTLADEKAKVIDTVKTDKKGEFVFEKVAPGKYLLSSAMVFPALVGQSQVTVPPNVEVVSDEKKTTIQLKAK